MTTLPKVSKATGPSHTALLEVNNLTTSFTTAKRSVKAVNDVSFAIMPGRVLGVVGESGSGKSVTARSILRTLRDPGKVDAGSVRFAGEELLTKSEGDMRSIRGNRIAMIFQDPQAALNPVMTIGAQIVEALRVHGVNKVDAEERALDLLRKVGIPDAERTIKQYPHEFSGGMRQRVVIAIALSNRPSLLIADEPTTALDVTIQAQILTLLVGLREELGLSIMMITHDMGVVAELCDDMIVMYGGRVVESGPVADVFREQKHPYTAALLKAIPRIDEEEGEKLLAIPGSPPDPAKLPAGCSFHPRCPVAQEICATERPTLTPRGEARAAACWVSEGGGTVSSLPMPTMPRGARASKPDQVILRITDLKTDVSTRRGLIGRAAPPVYAVDGVSLEVSSGETLGLVGESGCGKSTLSRTIVGINRPASGSIEVAGIDVSQMRAKERKTVSSTVQYIFQDPYASLNPRRTIEQSIDEALGQVGIRGIAAQIRTRDLIQRVGLNEDHLHRYPYEFSGGQRQRIGIARALATNPKMLICDEPVSALDVSIQAQIINLLEELRDDLGLGYLFIAHDLSVVRHLADRVAVMYLGRIVEQGTAAQVYGQPQHPYTAALISSTPEADMSGRDRERIVLRGDMPSPAAPPSGCRFRTRCPIGPAFFPGREKCMTDDPALAPTSTGQLAACHFPGELQSAGVSQGSGS